ncbi:MAG TPA: carboxypeptidase-like regulatory domain-containing protein, partial [Chitinophagaceae bacterium]|nr:carboxypeptidase-like regulatory domain-containing protein [Chitinophagaceae bacterium]
MRNLLLRFLLLLLLVPFQSIGQLKTISGTIKDAHSEEPVPFASVTFKNTTTGNQSDSSGSFRLAVNEWPSDTLEITCVGYQPYYVRVDTKKSQISLTINLERGTFSEGASLKVKVN